MVYFDVRGRGEVIHYALRDNKIPYENEVIHRPFQTWPKIKPTMNLLFAYLPKFIFDDGLELYQSNAILRHIARLYDLYGADDKEASQIDMVIESVADLMQMFLKMIFSNYDNRAEYIANLGKSLAPFEKLMKGNNDGTGFVVGNKISIADYSLFDILDDHLVLSPGCLDSFPVLTAFHDRISSRPNLNAYRASDDFTYKFLTPTRRLKPDN